MATFEASRNWCRANGISAALTQDSQRSAKDLLDELFAVMNSAPVYSGDQLKSIPYDEVSGAGNGAIYTAPTASGPIYYFDYTNIVRQSDKDVPVKCTRKRRADCDNVIALEYIERANDYMHNVVSQTCPSAVAQVGPRKGGTLETTDLGINNPSGAKQFLSISNATVATKIANILAKRSGTGVNVYEWTVGPQFFWLEAMDLVAITDVRLGLNQKPVRITSMQENQDRTWTIKADEFIYGLNHPDSVVAPTSSGTLQTTNVDVALVNTPIILEPTAQMLNSSSQAQLWFIVSDTDPNYGGCLCYISLDGGESYDQVVGNVPPCITGYTVGDFPITTDPDTTNTCSVDISETYGGAISSQTQTIADNFSDPCYLAGPDVYTYEVICPTAVTTNASSQYTFISYIRRGVQGTTIEDHPNNTRFGVMANALKVDLPGPWIGQVLYFKFAAYNQGQTSQNDLSECVPYTYTPQGFGNNTGSQSYTGLPTTVIAQQVADSTHLVLNPGLPFLSFPTFIVTWTDGKSVKYLARDGVTQPKISIPDPGTSPVTYYVSIHDPTRIGEVDASGSYVPLTLYCDTDQTLHAQAAGYTFVGKIIATHAGGNIGSVIGPAGINQILMVVG